MAIVPTYAMISQNMSWISSFELSIASRYDGGESPLQRKVTVCSGDTAHRNLGKSMLHSMATKAPAIADTLLRMQAAKHDYHYIGGGHDASVYRKRNDVVKVHRRSIGDQPEQQQLELQTREKDFYILAENFGKLVLPQSVFIDSHPLGSSEDICVQTLQPYCTFSSRLIPFRPFLEDIDVSALIELEKTMPRTSEELMEFVMTSQKLYEKTKKVPDINGTDNLVIQSDQHQQRLVLIDTTLLSEDQHPEIVHSILHRFNTIQALV
jgi:hypothetical protein